VTAYLTPAEFALYSTVPVEHTDALETVAPGWLAQQLETWSRQIDARLSKRYATPFTAPYPEVVKAWLARIVAVRVYLRRGVDATDLQFAEIQADGTRAFDEIKEAADSNVGLYDLPSVQGSTSSGVVRGGPFGYSEQSPYVWADGQARAGRSEDSNGSGSYG
jgi:phage gp36-like protein